MDFRGSNGKLFKLYNNKLEIIQEGEEPIVINLNRIETAFLDNPREPSFMLFGYTITFLDRSSIIGVNQPYILKIYDETYRNGAFPRFTESIPDSFFERLRTILMNYYEGDNTNTNNNFNYPNNNQRNNRNIPTNATNDITYENINDGTNMVNFHDEFFHGRFYKRNTFNRFQPNPNSGKKKNPFTQQNIEPGNITRYTARKPAAGGRRRKTMKRRRVNKKKHTYRRR